MSISHSGRSTSWRSFVDHGFKWLGFTATMLLVAVLIVLLASIFVLGARQLDWSFLTSNDSSEPALAGIKPALVGSVYMLLLTAVVAVPTGVATAIYLEEYAGGNRLLNLLRTVIKTNISNLAGVPSIVYGILGLAVFVHYLGLGYSLLTGALTLALVILPMIIIASQEAIRAVSDSVRHASYALGATRWQTVRRQVLPAALPGIMTGIILSLSRAIGEAAPLIAVGAVAYVNFLPQNPLDKYTVLPIQIFQWSSEAKSEYHQLAAGGIIVLLTLLLCMNGIAVFIRYRYSRFAGQ